MIIFFRNLKSDILFLCLLLLLALLCLRLVLLMNRNVIGKLLPILRRHKNTHLVLSGFQPLISLDLYA